MQTPEDHDAHEGTSDATPGGLPGERRPGEAVFAAILAVASIVLLWNAYGIAGFSALSSPGAIPMATTAVMAVTAVIVLVKTLRLPRTADETVSRDILPPVVIVMALMLVAYGILLRPLGFIPTSALFLVAAIKILSNRSWGFTLAVSLGSLVLIWLIFRIVFTVLMPAGIVPEAEFVQMLRDIVQGGSE
ncbi:tripartite tricarboxylate transporter TctB family protein [Rhodobacterales bacterium HKCCE2091]|nr:tripartite tricarboxylate transporter TctB family protein [Rhodobacterales bacterium HKCCE2091]